MTSPHDPAQESHVGTPPGEQADHRGIIGWWASNGVAANLLMIVSIIAGIMGFLRMDREVFPTAGFNGMTVSVAWPGASPQEIEEQILLRIEESILGLEGIEEVTSNANEGNGSVNIEASRSIDMVEFIDKVKLRVDSINNLPPSAFRPIVRQWENNDTVFGIALHGSVDPLELRRLGDQIRDEIARLPGASRARLDAALPEEVNITVTEEARRRYGVTISEVAQAIRSSSVNTSSGSIETATGNVAIATRQEAQNAEDFEDIIIRQTADGGVLRVGDVAEVNDGLLDAPFLARFNGEPMVLIQIASNQDSNNVVRTQKALKAYMEAKELPPGLSLTLWWDNTETYYSRLQTISNSAFIGLALVLITLLLFLRPAVAFWVTIGIFTAFAGTFALLPALGVSLNMLSLFAFLIVIGVIVDDAIIVGENIHNQVERGHRGIDAAVLGTQLVMKPVIFAVITTMMAFAPWMMLSGPEVNFTRQISLVVIAALTFSLIESLLILPNHLAHLKPQKNEGLFGPLLRFQSWFANGLIWVARTLYRPVVATAIKARYVTVTLFFALFVLTVSAWTVGGLVKFNFMPEVEGDSIQVRVSLPQGTSFERTEQVADQIMAAEESFQEEIQRRYDTDIQLVEATSAFAWGNTVQSWISTAPPEDRPIGLSTKEMSEVLREAVGPIPDAEEVSFNFTFNNSSNSVQFALNSRDFNDLRAAADDLKTKLASYDAVFEVRDNLQSAADELQIELKPGAAALGLTQQDVSRQLARLYFGEEAKRLPREGSDVPVYVRYSRAERESLDSLDSVLIRTPSGQETPLTAVAEWDFAPGINRITRRNNQRALYVTADVQGDAASEIREDLNANFFPEWQRRHPNVSRDAIGDAEGQRQFLQEMQGLTLMMLLAMYVLIAVAFRSVFQPLLVMTAIPFGLVGAIIGHMIAGVPMALFSFFGVGAAAGVVINDNLVLIDYVNRLRRNGLGCVQALVEAGVARFRPILLTSVTTFLGVLPMMAERSTQAEFLKPMVISLGYAIVFALFLTLILVPALYAVGADIARVARWIFLRKPFKPVGSGYDPDDHEVHGDMGVAPAE